MRGEPLRLLPDRHTRITNGSAEVGDASGLLLGQLSVDDRPAGLRTIVRAIAPGASCP
jgi:hypothetical protein